MKNGLQFMTWKEIDKAIETDPVVIIPLGSMEQHGPHCPAGDFLICEELAQTVAAAAGAYYLPVIPFGYSEYFRCYPGTISLRQETMSALLRDISISLLEHDIKKIVFFNGHGGNSTIIEGVARDILREKKIVMGKVEIWQMISQTTKKDLYGTSIGLLGHGGDPVTSVMMFRQAENMRMDLCSESKVTAEWEGFAIDRSLDVILDECRATMYFDMDRMTCDGMQGDPAVSSAEKGRVLYEEMERHCLAFIRQLQKSDTVWRER